MSSLIGQSLGRYQILEQLGEGGMATVYKAYDTRLERFVAIKVIRTDQFAPSLLEEMMKRFEREAKALAKLSHPNIVHVHDYGEYEGAPYLVMEYLPSGTLKQRPGDPMPWQQALRIILPIAQALAYAHEHNIIHRDIKPGNILLTEKGLPMLSDFGIAKILESTDTATLTGAGMTIGTPEYMAPEQWTGNSGPLSDIYSLGVVLYELVTGRKPFTADTPVAVMLKQIKDPLPRPRQFVPDLPEDLENVLLKALQRQPEERYQSMNEFAAALEALTGGQTLSAGVNLNDFQADETVLASGSTGKGTGPEKVLATDDSKPASGSSSEIQAPPTGRRASNKRRPWIALTAVIVLLCIGSIAGIGLVMRGLKPRASLTNQATNIVPSPTAPSLTGSQTLAGSVSTQPTSTPPATSILPSTQVKVLWDISHGPSASSDGTLYTPDGMYKALAQTLANQKFMITSGDLTDLNSYDILVLSETSAVKTPFSSAEADQIEQYVRASGHGLLILGDIPTFQNLIDVISSRFSIGLGESTSDGPVSFSNEPFFSGVNSVQFLAGGGIFHVTSPSQTAAQDKNANSVIAFCECEAGRVLAVSDSNLWDNQGLNQGDNRLLATNVFLWLMKLTP
jgi:serine/threonine protein kinase